jgi:ATP-binding cassette, subfamily B, multidrug efflux pump
MSGRPGGPGGDGRGPLIGGDGRRGPVAGAPGRGSIGAPTAGGPPHRPMGGGMFGRGPMGGMMAPAAKARDFRGSLGRLIGELRPERRRVILVIVLAIFSVTASVVGPKLLGNATNILFEGVVGKQLGERLPPGTTQQQLEALLRSNGQGQIADMLSGMHVVPGVGVDFGALGGVLAVVAAIYVVSALFGWASAYIIAGVAQRTVYRLRREVDEKLARLPLRYFDGHPRGDTLSRVTNDIDNIANTLQQSMTQAITSVLTVVGVLIIMFSISPLLAIISLLVVPLAISTTVVIARRSQTQFAAQWERTGTLNGFVEEVHTGHNLVKVFGHRDEAIRTFDAENEKLFEASYRAQFISGVIQPSMNFLSNLNYVAIAVIGGVQVASGTMSLGDVQAFIQYSRQFTMPITQLASIANVFQSAIASAERVFELLDEAEEVPDTDHPRELSEVAGGIELAGVSFRYEPETPLIDDLHLRVEPGDTIAIVGPTGAGKTTLVNLLMRFYEIDGGTISVDGIDIRDLRRDDLRRTFGMVLQDTWLFGGTIRENIAYGVEDAPEDRIVAAAQAAHVDHFVRTLPDGYETLVDDEASNLSQGERQLLTIARAFLADPKILILDEATSSVDTRTEVLVQRAMARLMKGRTSFVIAHRLSTVRDAHTILVMDHGRIVEQGRHEDLLAARGFYFELYNSQFVEPLAEAV